MRSRPSRADEGCQQLITVPGIGPIISSAMVAAIGNGAAFCKARHFAAWLGLVPKQMSTGDRTILGHITKRGNRYLRALFIQGARAVLLRPASWAKHSFGSWLTSATRPRRDARLSPATPSDQAAAVRSAFESLFSSR